MLPSTNTQLGDGAVASSKRDCHPSALKTVDREVCFVLALASSLGACVTVLPCRAAGRRARQSCAAWTSIGSGNWKCVERHLHHRCYLLILVCKGPYYPAVTAATCIRLLTPVCFLLVLPTFISALASALFLVWWSCCFMKSHFLCSD